MVLLHNAYFHYNGLVYICARVTAKARKLVYMNISLGYPINSSILKHLSCQKWKLLQRLISVNSYLNLTGRVTSMPCRLHTQIDKFILLAIGKLSKKYVHVDEKNPILNVYIYISVLICRINKFFLKIDLKTITQKHSMIARTNFGVDCTDI